MPEIAPFPLSQLTTLRTGGTPTRLVVAETRDELVETLRDVWGAGERWLVVGGGSNLFVGDEPFEGTVILVRTRGIRREPSPREGFVRVVVEAGEDWDGLVASAVAEGLSGIEAMSGIPGTVGGAPVQNIGAYGQEIVQTLVEVELLDEETGEVSIVDARDLGLAFRTSVLKHHHGGEPARVAVILSVTFELETVGSGARPVAGEQLRQALGLREDEAVSLQGIRTRVLATRARKGMVPYADDPDTWSAGSFFQNAIVSDAFARTLPVECPRWPLMSEPDRDGVIPLAAWDGVLSRQLGPVEAVAPSEVKVSSAWLIEAAGFTKGFHLPRSRAALSTKHALAVTNRGHATAAEIAELARYIRLRVLQDFGLELQPEPVLVDVEL